MADYTNKLVDGNGLSEVIKLVKEKQLQYKTNGGNPDNLLETGIYTNCTITQYDIVNNTTFTVHVQRSTTEIDRKVYITQTAYAEDSSGRIYERGFIFNDSQHKFEKPSNFYYWRRVDTDRGYIADIVEEKVGSTGGGGGNGTTTEAGHYTPTKGDMDDSINKSPSNTIIPGDYVITKISKDSKGHIVDFEEAHTFDFDNTDDILCERASVSKIITFTHNNKVTAATKGSTTTNDATANAGNIDVIGGIQYDANGHIKNVYSRKINLQNTTYSKASQTQDGLMSADDKKKLDGLSSTGSSGGVGASSYYNLEVITKTEYNKSGTVLNANTIYFIID